MEQALPSRPPRTLNKHQWPIGTPVDVRYDDGRIVETETVTMPRLFGGHTWGVHVGKILGPVKLTRVTYRVPPEEQLVEGGLSLRSDNHALPSDVGEQGG